MLISCECIKLVTTTTICWSFFYFTGWRTLFCVSGGRWNTFCCFGCSQ